LADLSLPPHLYTLKLTMEPYFKLAPDDPLVSPSLPSSLLTPLARAFN